MYLMSKWANLFFAADVTGVVAHSIFRNRMDFPLG